MPIDLDVYFRRIGHTNSPAPDLGTLREIGLRHTERIPFENLDPLLGRPAPLDARSLEQKLVHEGRGGYCFEQNLLLKYVLEAIGFSVVGVAARILWDRGVRLPPADTCCFSWRPRVTGTLLTWASAF